MGRSSEASRRLDASFEQLRQLKSYPADKIKPGSEPDEALSALAAYQAGSGNKAAALETYRKLLDHVLAWQPSPDTNLFDAVEISRLYAALAELRHPGAQEARLKLWKHWDAKLPDNDFVRRQLAAAAYGQL